MGKKIFVWLLILIISISVIGCGSKATETATVADAVQPVSDAFYDITTTSKDEREVRGNSEASSADFGSSTEKNKTVSQQQSIEGQITVPSVDVNQKVIFTGQIDFETLDFEKTTTELSKYITSVGGYPQNSSVHGGRIGYTGLRSAEYVFRIPKTKYMQAFVDLKKIGTVVFEQSSGQDITDQYFDTEARLKSLKVQQDRLMALLEKADKMEDILKIEKELQTTLYEIENYTGTIKKWDSLIEYSTLSVNVREVAEIKPEVKENDGLFTRISVGFKNSILGVWEFIQSFLVFIASALPVIIPLVLIGYLVYRLIRKKMKKDKENKVKSE